MKHSLFINILLAVVLPLMALSCSSNEDNSEEDKHKAEADSIKSITEAMMSEEYFPVGTQWDELHVVMRETDSATYAATGEYYLPYEYYLEHYTVDYDIDFNGKRIHHVEAKIDFVLTEEGKTERELFGYVVSGTAELYLEEDSGRVYNLVFDPEEYYLPELVYDFVWTEGKELYRTIYCWHRADNVYESEHEDEMEYLGTVTADSVEYRTLLDGKKYMYMPKSKMYRGIGTVEKSIFYDESGYVPTMTFEMYEEEIGLARFSRGGTLIYEDQELLNMVSDKYK